MTEENYIELLFDVNRGGFVDLAEKILGFLDFLSFAAFKRTCKTVYQFIKSSNLEQVSAFSNWATEFQIAKPEEQN